MQRSGLPTISEARSEVRSETRTEIIHRADEEPSSSNRSRIPEKYERGIEHAAYVGGSRFDGASEVTEDLSQIFNESLTLRTENGSYYKSTSRSHAAPDQQIQLRPESALQGRSSQPHRSTRGSHGGSSMSNRTKVSTEEHEKLKREVERLRSEKLRDEEKIRYMEQERSVSTKVRLNEIRKVVQQAQELDIAFLVDATDSMQPLIDMVKDQIGAMAADISSSYSQFKLRVALAVYRDYDEPVDDGCNFTSSYKTPDSEFSRALSRIICEGGEDYAEDVFTGLENAAGLDWQSTNRLLVHIGDAPCHGSQFHDLGNRNDNYFGGDKYGRDIQTILQTLRWTCKINFYCFCHVTDNTHKMVQEFRNVAGDDWVQEWQLSDISKIPEHVVRVSKLTIANSLSVFQKGGNAHGTHVKEKVEETVPNWTLITTQEGTEYIHERISSLSHLLDTIREARPLELRKSTNVQLQIAPQPFSGEGAVRWPYYALIKESGQPPREVVIKRFKTPFGLLPTEVHAKKRYIQQMEVQTVAACMAEAFSERTRRLRGVMKIQFTKVSLLDVGGKFYTKEKRLRGEWTRFSNNGEYVNMVDYAATLQAFSHWTYHVSNGLLMVTDLQGITEPDEKLPGRQVFCLCDPAIHTNNGNVRRFTGTNLGEVGFRLFLDNHQCNDICRHLSLPVGKCGHIYQGTIVTWIQ